MPKLYGIMITGCMICELEPEMRPFVGDKDDATRTRDAWVRDEGQYTPCIEAQVMRLKLPRVTD